MSERVAAVVVNHDAGDALTECVASLRLAGIDELVVVDNASSDGSLGRLAAQDPVCTLVPTGANLGYGSAANRGAARSGAEYLLIANPDLVVERDAVKLLVAELDSHPDVAVVGPKILDKSGATYPSARAFPSFATPQGTPSSASSSRTTPSPAAIASREPIRARSAPSAGSPAPSFWSGGSPFKASAASTRATSCTSKTSISAGACAGPVGRCATSPTPSSSTRRASPRRAIPTGCSSPTTSRPGASRRRRAEGAERLALPVVGAGLGVRLAIAVLRERSLRRNRHVGGR